jgi:glycogen operon protein
MTGFPPHLEDGAPYPLGATPDGLGVNFAVFSQHAEKVELCLFDRHGKRETARLPLPSFTGEVWHGYLPGAAPGLVYGYRVHGPYEPRNGHRFNPNKLLLDPYAKQLVGRLRWTDALFGYRVRSSHADLSFDRRDSAPAMVKAAVTEDRFNWHDDKRPNTPWPDTVIYELHVRGFTRLLDSVSPPERGTFAALTHPDVIAYLQRLGVTAVELMPIHAFIQDRYLVDKKLSNYWGYNTLAYFAPERRFLSTGNGDEIRLAVRRLHAAGIEVILDVVYNHTCEGSELGPTLSWRGFDNAVYYRLCEDRRHIANDTGTGNTLDLTHARALQMVTDSLRYWAESFHVDGFRFDLGATLGREHWGFDPGAGFFDALRQDPVLSRLKLISEPWDVGPGGYQLGNHPPPFAEWNDRYRDAVRRYWRGDEDMRPELARRLSGSADIFSPSGRRPWASINFVASHDGMTLADLVTYENKHNEANQEDNRDGHNDNLSSHWGVEGPTDNPAISRLRDRVAHSMLATLFLSRGTPMLLAGDEFGRTQQGNNNAYCQDNNISWIDWTAAMTEIGKARAAFVSRLIAIRKQYPVLTLPRYLYGSNEILRGLPEIDWFDERGERLSDEDWGNVHARAFVLRRASLRSDGGADVLAFMMNAWRRPLHFQLPGPFRWRLLLDTADVTAPPRELSSKPYTVQDRAAVLIAAVAEPSK